MEKLNRDTIKPDKKLAAVCGLYCPSCTLFIGNHEDPARLKVLTERMGKAPEEMKCNGCRSDVLSFFCRTCTMKSCAKKKGIEFCSQCDQYPCKHIKAFQSEAPHRAEIWNSLHSIKSEGWEQWFTDITDMSSCPECGTINSAYDIICRNCGSRPGSEFVEKHNALVLEHLKKLKG